MNDRIKLPTLPLGEEGINMKSINVILSNHGKKQLTTEEVEYINLILCWVAKTLQISVPEIQFQSRKKGLYPAARAMVVFALVPWGKVSCSFIGALVGQDWAFVSNTRKVMEGKRKYGLYADEFAELAQITKGDWDSTGGKNPYRKVNKKVKTVVEIREVVRDEIKLSDLRLFGERLLLVLGQKDDFDKIEKCISLHYPEEVKREQANKAGSG